MSCVVQDQMGETNMRTAIAIIALFALLGPAQAGQVEDARATLITAIDRVEQVFMPQCKRTAAPKACVAGYKMAIARNRASLAELDFWLETAPVKAESLRSELTDVVPVDEYNRDNRVTVARSNKIDAIFGIKAPAASRN